MPIYGYRCRAGHEQDWLGRFDARPVALSCGECGAMAIPVPALTARGIVRGGTDGGKGEGRRNRDGFTEESPGVWVKGKEIRVTLAPYLCGGCGYRGLGDDVLPAACEKCGSANVSARELEWGRSWWEAEGFNVTGGYYDRGAGRWFASKGERAAWAEANGMVEIAGVNDDTDRAVRKESERQRELCEFWREELRQRDADIEYREMRARGLVPDDSWLRDEVGYRE